MRKVSLLLAFSVVMLIPAFGQVPSAARKVDNEFVQQQFGREFTLLPELAPVFGDLDGDGVEDVAIAARCKNPMLDEAEHNYRVMDPYYDFYGYGDPRVTTTLKKRANLTKAPHCSSTGRSSATCRWAERCSKRDPVPQWSDGRPRPSFGQPEGRDAQLSIGKLTGSCSNVPFLIASQSEIPCSDGAAGGVPACLQRPHPCLGAGEPVLL